MQQQFQCWFIYSHTLKGTEMGLWYLKHTLNYQTTLHNSNIETAQTILPKFGTNYFTYMQSVKESKPLLLTQGWSIGTSNRAPQAFVRAVTESNSPHSQPIKSCLQPRFQCITYSAGFFSWQSCSCDWSAMLCESWRWHVSSSKERKGAL